MSQSKQSTRRPSESIKVTDLAFDKLLQPQVDAGQIFFNQRRAVILDATALGTLRQQLIETLGEAPTMSVLASFGYSQGRNDAQILGETIEWETETDWLAAGPSLHALEGLVQVEPKKVEFDRETGHFHMHGVWRNSYEAEQHLRIFGPSDYPVCWTLTGYASGYASVFFGRELLAIETECVAQGDERCYWEIRPVEEWGDDPKAVPYLAALERVDIAGQLAEVNQQLQERNRQLVRQSRRLAALNEITAAISSALDLGGIFAAVAREMQTIIPFDRASIALYDKEANGIRVLDVQTQEATRLDQGRILPLEGTAMGHVLRTGHHLFFIDITQPDAQAYLELETLAQEGLRSIMTVPMQRGDRVIGSFNIGSQKIGAYDEGDLTLLHQVANQVAIALQNAQLFEEVEATAAQAAEQAEQFATILQGFQEIQAITDLESQVQAMAEGVVEARLFRRVLLRLFDDAAQTIHVYSGYAGLTEQEVAQLKSTPPMSKERRSQLLQDVFRISNSYFFPSGHLPDPGEAVIIEGQQERGELESWEPMDQLLVPLWIGDKMVGLFSVDDPFDGQRPTAESLLPMELFADLAAQVIENSRLLTDTENLYQTMGTLTQARTVREIMQATVARMRDAVNAEQAIMFLVDHDRKHLTDIVQAGHAFQDLGQMTYQDVWKGLGGQAMRTNTPILSPGADDPRESEEDRQRRKQLGIGSLIILPLVEEGGQTFGEITLINRATQRQFTQRDLDLLSTISSQVSIALQNLRLLDDTQRRAVQLQTAADVARAASSVLDQETLFSDTIELIRQRFNYYYVGIFITDPRNEWAVLQAGTGEAGQEMLAAGHKLEIGGDSMIGDCVASAQARIALDVGEEARRFDNPHLPDTRSEMALPLVSRGEVIGAMTIQSEQEAAFSDEDVAVLQTMADQVAIAIANARLFEEQQQARSLLDARLNELDCLNDIGRKTDETPPIPEFLEWVAQRIPPAMRYPDLCRVAITFDGTLYGAPQAVELPHQIVGGLHISSEKVGQITIAYTEDRDFVDEESALLGDIVRRIGGYVENQRLIEQIQQRAGQLEWLTLIESTLSQAANEEEILTAITMAVDLEHLPERIDLQYLETGENDRPTHAYITAAWQDGIVVPDHPDLYQRRPVEELATADLWLDAPDTTILIPNVHTDPNTDEQTRKRIIDQGFQGLALMPLRSGGRWQGLVSFLWTEPHTFPLDEEYYLGQLLEPASAVVASRRAYLAQQASREESEHRALQLQTAAEVSSVVSSILDPDVLIKRIVELVQERMQLYYAGLFLVDQTGAQTGQAGHWAVLQAGTGEAGQEMLAKGHKLEIGGDSMIGDCVANAQARIALDVGEEARRFDNPHLPDTRSEMALPLIARGQTLGAMTIQSEQEAAFSDEDVAVLQTMADQVAIAIANARLFEEQQQARSLLDARLNELDCLNDIGRKTDETPPIPEFLEWVAQRIPPAMHYPDLCRVAITFDGTLYGAPQAVELARQIVSGLYAGGEKVGQITIAYTEDRDFVDEESALLGDIVRRIGGYVENQLLFEQTRYRAMQLQTAAEVSRAASSILDPTELIQQVVDLAQERFDLYYAGLFLVDRTGEWTGEPGKWAMLRAGTGQAGQQMMQEKHKLEIGDTSMIGWCIANRQARIALDVGEEAVRFDNPHLPDTRSEMALPLIIRDQAIGAMSIQSEKEAAFSDEDIAVLQTMADQVAAAIQNGRLYQESITLYLATQAISQAETTQKALERAANYIFAPLYDTCALLIFGDPSRRETLEVIASWTKDRGAPPLPEGAIVDRSRFPLFDLINRQEIVIFNDFAQDSRINPELAQRMMDRGAQSALSVPLAAGPNWLGLMLAQGPHPTALGAEERRAFESLANQLAAFIQNLQLLEETQQALEEVQRLHRQQIRESWREYLLSTKEAQSSSYLLDRQELVPDPDLQYPEIDLVLKDNRTIAQDREQSTVVVPISLRGQVIGTLGIEDPNNEQSWNEDDIALLEAVSSQLGLAIDNARLSEQTRASLAETQTLFETSRSLAAAQEMKEIWQAVVEAARMRRADACALFLFDTLERENAQNLVLAAGWDRHEQARLTIGTRLALSRFRLFETLHPDAPFMVTDLTQAENIDEGSRDLLNSLDFSALIHQPIAVRGRWFGFLSILYESPHQFTRAETDFYRTLSDQAALAIEGQRLLSETQRRAEREQLIRQITEKVRATTNIETILQTTVQELSKAMGLPRAFVRLGTREQLGMIEHSSEPVKTPDQEQTFVGDE